MGSVVRNPVIANSPPGWEACDAELGRYRPPVSMGFPCKPGDLNRFASRYRLAKSFRAIELDGYAQSTVEGYGSLLCVFLSYSAFEQFMECCGTNPTTMASCLGNYNDTGCEAAIRKIPGYDQFLSAVLEHLDKGSATEKNYQEFLAGKPCNILYLATGVRHIFTHGQLTPNAGVGYTGPTQEVSHLLVILLFRVMDGEFVARLLAHGVKL